MVVREANQVVATVVIATRIGRQGDVLGKAGQRVVHVVIEKGNDVWVVQAAPWLLTAVIAIAALLNNRSR